MKKAYTNPAIKAMHDKEFQGPAKPSKFGRLLKMCGLFPTAQNMKNKGYSLEEALMLLLGTRERMLHVRTAEQSSEFKYV